MSHDNRVPPGPVIVTGGSSGLGAAVVDTLAGRGGSCVVLDRNRPAQDVPWVKVDLADPEAAATAVDEAWSLAGVPAGVVTAAGIDACGRLEEVDPRAWHQVLAVNLLGTVAVIRACLPGLRQTNGRVVTVASTLGVKAVSDATAYCASKFGVVGFTRALAAETAGEVGVTLLIPGGMRTAFFDDRPEKYRPGPDAVLSDPRDVADIIAFALARPHGLELREIVACTSRETSWP